MEKLLARIARQLDAVDEASLMSLWNKYATLASRFEPTRRWEEAVLIFSLIQAKRMKNQLFNYYWSAQVREENAGKGTPPLQSPLAAFQLNRPVSRPDEDDEAEERPGRACRVLAFQPPRQKD